MTLLKSLFLLGAISSMGQLMAQSTGPTLTITNASLPVGVLDQAYPTTQLNTTGGTGPYTYFFISTGTPPGISLSSSGELAGSPFVPGDFPVTIGVTDSANGFGSRTYNLQVTGFYCPTAYSFLGQNYSSSVSLSPFIAISIAITGGKLPTGLAMDSAGVITGTAGVTGVSAFTLTAVDRLGSSVSRTCSISVISELQTSSPRTTARFGIPYRSAIGATGGSGSYTHTIVTGALPAGLTLNSTSGTISGTPNVIGPSNFRVRTQDSVGRVVDGDFTIYSIGREFTPALRCSLPSATPNRLYSSSLSLNVTGTATFSIQGTLPAGLILDPATGRIFGTPTQSNFSEFTAQASVLGGPVVTASCTISVAETNLPYLNIACPDQEDILLNDPFASPAIATGGVAPYTYSLYQSSLPTGLSLNSATGLVAGTMTAFPPTRFDNFAEAVAQPNQASQNIFYWVAVTDATGNSTYTNSVCQHLVSDTPPLKILTTSLPRALFGTNYAATIQFEGGIAPFSASNVGLPNGYQLNISGNNLVINGPVPGSGSFSFRAIIRDSTGQVSYRDYVVQVDNENPLRFTSRILGGGTVGLSYFESVQADGGTPPYRFSLASGTLPGGVTFGQDGNFRGVPTTAGTYRLDILVADNSGATETTTFSLVIFQGSFRLGCPNLSAEVGVPYSSSANVLGGSQPYSFSIANGQLPGGLGLDSVTGAISGTPIAAGAFIFTFSVSDARLARTQTQCSIGVVGGSLRIITEGPITTKAAAPYQGQLQAAGGTVPYQWTLLSSSPEAGIAVTSAGAFSGSATKKGSFTATVQAKDAAGATATKTLAIVATDSSVTLACPATTTFQLGALTAGKFVLAGGSAPYRVTLFSGAFPPGFELASSGDFTVRPTLGGTYAAQVRAMDSTDTAVTTRCSFEVTGNPLLITTSSLPDGTVAAAYSGGVSSSGGVGRVRYSLTSGGLPAGLELDSASGNISGIPESAGNFAVGVGVTDELQRRAAKILSLKVDGGSLPFRITTASPLSDGFVGKSYQAGFAADGGKAPYTFTISGLPAGIDASSDSISGTPTAAGDATVAVTARDAAGASVSKSFLLRVKADGVIIITSTLPDGTQGQPYVSGLTREGGRAPFTWTILRGSMPDGLVFNPTTGEFEGVPTTNGQYNVTVEVTDSLGASSRRTFEFEVRPEGVSRLSITSASLPDGNAGASYTSVLGAAGGRGPFAWGINGDLPPGLSLANDGTIAGIPQTVGNYSFLVLVTDSLGLKAQRVLSLRIGTNSVPALSIDGLTDTTAANQNLPFTLRMASAFGVPVTGRLTLTFVPDSIHGADDPSIRFANTTRTFDFTVAANSTTVVLGGGAATISTGTLAGTIRLSSVLNFAGASAPGPTRSISVAPAIPVITNLSLTRSGGSLEIRIEGFTNTRQLSEARVTFTASGDVDLTTASQVTVNIASAIQSWFASAASQPFGGRFAVTLPFTVSGNASAITGVSVVITNGQGSSAPATAN